MSQRPIGSGTDWSLLSSIAPAYSKPYDSRNAPWWKKSSPIHVSVIGACGEIAFTAGCGLMPAIVARKPGIRDAEDADAPVVVRHVLEEPVDRVVGVGALVGAFRVGGIVQRAVHEELALAAESPADVLVDEDVPVRGEEPIVVPHRRVAGDAVWRARDEDGQRGVRAPRLADARVEPNAVAHRDHHEAAGERGALGAGTAEDAAGRPRRRCDQGMNRAATRHGCPRSKVHARMWRVSGLTFQS